jgi:hypothetical protein
VVLHHGREEKMVKDMNTSTTPEASIRLLNEREIAETLDVSIGTVRRWRLLRKGPPFLKVGVLVKYPMRGLELWLTSRPMGGERHMGA